MGRKALSDVPKLKTITIPNTFEYDGSDTSYTIFDGVQGPFSYSNIETVVFEDGIEQIPDGICYNMADLKSVVIPDSVKIIGNDSFSVSALESVDIPDSVTKIEYNAFSTAESLASVKMSKSIETIETEAFRATAISAIDLPEGLKSLGQSVFRDCKELKEITIPSTVEDADVSLCDSYIETVNIADGMTKLPDRLCDRAAHFSKINIPYTVTDLGSYTFQNTESFKEFTLPKQVTKSTYAFYNSGLETIHFEEGITTVPENLFYNAVNLKIIDWCSTIDMISSYSFKYCIGLETLVIPESVKHIGYEAFSYAEGLTSLTLPESECEMGSYVFYGAKSLKSVYVPSGLYGDDYNSTFYNSGLESITFAPDIKEIPPNICAYCESLTEINWPDSPEKINNGAFAYCSSLKDAKLPDSLTAIKSGAFGNTGLETVHIPANLTTLESGAFANTTSLKYLYMPFDKEEFQPAFAYSGIETLEYAEGIEAIYDTCYNLQNLKKVTIPESVKSIGDNAFNSAKSLQEVKLPSNLETIGGYAFSKTAISEITIPKTVNKCGSAIFSGSLLASITFEDGMETIPDNICYSADNLFTAHIPASVTRIGAGAFNNCTNLAALDMPQDEISFDYTTFDNCYNLYDERVDMYSRADTFMNRVETSRGKDGLVNYTIYYKVNPRFEKDAVDGYINVYTKSSNSIVKASLDESLRDGYDSEYQTGFTYKFTNLENEGVIRFSTRPSENADMAVDAQFYLRMDNDITPSFYAYCRKHIITDSGQKSKLSINTPVVAPIDDGNAHFSVSGYYSGESVTVYVNGEEYKTVTPSKYTARYSADISVPAEEASSVSVYAQSGSDKSETKSVKCEGNTVIPEKVIFSYHAHPDKSMDITDAFITGVTPYVTLNPAYPYGFEVTLSNNDCGYVAVSSTTNGSTSYIELTFDETSGTWKGEGYFDTRVPGTLNICAIRNQRNYRLEQKSDGTLMIDGHKFMEGADENSRDIADEIIKDSKHFVNGDDNNIFAGYDLTDALGSEAYIGQYIGRQDSLVIDGKAVTPLDVASSPESYGFAESPMTMVDADGDIHKYYVKITDDTDYIQSVMENIYVEDNTAANASGYRYASEYSAWRRFWEDLASLGAYSDTAGKAANGSLVVEMTMDAATGAVRGDKANGFVVNVTTESEKGILDLYAKSKGFGTASSRVGTGMTYLEIGTQGLGMLHELHGIINSDDPRVQKHEDELCAVAVGTTMAKATVTLAGSAAVGSAITEAAVVIAGGAAILPTVLGVVAIIGTVYAAGVAIDAVSSWMKKLILDDSTITNDARMNVLIDPSGIAYEWLPSNPVANVTAEIYYQDESGNAVKWNAEDYDQVNPQITDNSGWFAWDVPEGMWQIRISGEGYEDAQSEWLPVLPVQTDVNIKLTSNKPAEITDAGYGAGAAVVKFSKHMIDSSMTADSIIIRDKDGNVVPCDIAPVKEEGNGTEASMTFMLTPKSTSGLEGATVSVNSGALSYAGVSCESAEFGLRALSDDEIPTPPQPSAKLGDVNDDGAVDSSDAALILKDYATAQAGGTSTLDKSVADYNSDDAIDSSDAALILKAYAQAQAGK